MLRSIWHYKYTQHESCAWLQNLLRSTDCQKLNDFCYIILMTGVSVDQTLLPFSSTLPEQLKMFNMMFRSLY